jgi:hypothetical protein
MINNEEVLTTIIDAFSCSNIEIQQYAIRIIGNILAESEDYAGDLTKYHLLDKIYPLLSHKNPTVKRDTCWVLSNYAYETAAANEILNKKNIMERLTIMLRN